jgi:energy-coupling factor transporter ATP-binding protein EcfA2
MDVVIGMRDGLAVSEQFGITTEKVPFGLSIAERRQHVMLLGKTGVGKSTLLRNMIVQDIQAGRGCLFIDPHGDEADRLLDFVPPWRAADVIYVDPTDLSHPIGFNLLEREPAEDRALVASNIVSIFKHFWGDSWGARSEYLLLCSVAAVLDYPTGRGDVSLLAVQRLLSDTEYRRRVVACSRNEAVRVFWEQEFPTWAPQFAAQALSPLENKLGALLASPATRLMLGQAGGRLRLAAAMDTGKIIIARLPKGLIGEDVANLIGSLLVNAVQQAAMRRAKIPEDDREDVVVYLDEFINFTTDAFASILSELRKYHVGFVLSGQFLAQQRPSIRAAVIGNIGTLVAFQLGHDDADELAPVLAPYGVEALTWLDRGQIAVRISTGGGVAAPFLGETYSEIGWWFGDQRRAVLEQSRRRYGTPRPVVEAKLARWGAEPAVPPPPKRTRTPRPPMIVNIEHFYQAEPEASPAAGLEAAALGVKAKAKRVGEKRGEG